MAAMGEPREEERIRVTASRYAQQFPWLDDALFEAYISLLQTLRVHAVAIERYLGSTGQPKPISAPRHTVLRALFFAEGYRLSQTEASREVGVSPTNITNLVDGLERDGLVTRSTMPGDRRAKYVQLTDAGLEFCSSFIPAVAEFMASVFKDLNPDELARFNELRRASGTACGVAIWPRTARWPPAIPSPEEPLPT